MSFDENAPRTVRDMIEPAIKKAGGTRTLTQTVRLRCLPKFSRCAARTLCSRSGMHWIV